MAFQCTTLQHSTSKIGEGLAPKANAASSPLVPLVFRPRFCKNSFSCRTFDLLKSSTEPFSPGRTDISRKVQSEKINLSFHIGKLCKCDVLIMRQITPRQNVFACAKLSISGHFFSHNFQSDQSLPRALGFILCAACGLVVLLHAARIFYYFVVIEIAFMDNQAQITATINRLD